MGPFKWNLLSSTIISSGMFCYVVSTFESVDEIPKCDHSNKSYRAVLSCGAIYYPVHGNSTFWICGWNPKVRPFTWKVKSNTFLLHCLLCFCKVVLPFQFVDKINSLRMVPPNTDVFLQRLWLWEKSWS